MTIKELALEVWKEYNKIDKTKYRIKNPSIPIMYFGDYEKYIKSPLKVITVGLNPSHEEFPTQAPFKRFFGAEKIYKKEKLDESNTEIYLNSLNTYFKNQSYNWFDNFEPILNEMDCSFYLGYRNTALHTDFCSPYATNVTWAEYEKTTSKESVKDIGRKGTKFWNDLVNILKPDAILVSLRRSYRESFFKNQNLDWRILIEFTKKANGQERKNAYKVTCSIVNIDETKSLLVYGPNNVVPFMITTEPKKNN